MGGERQGGQVEAEKRVVRQGGCRPQAHLSKVLEVSWAWHPWPYLHLPSCSGGTWHPWPERREGPEG